MPLDFSKRPTDLNSFFANMRPYVFAFAYRVCGRVDEAEDITQNAMVDGFMQYAEDATLIPRPHWFLHLAFQEMKNNRDYDLSPADDEETLVEPMLTPEEFWRPLHDAGLHPSTAKVSLKESFHVGFLTLLQKLEFKERVAFVLSEVLALPFAEMQLVMAEKGAGETLKKNQAEAKDFFEKYFFSQDPKKIAWRSCGDASPALKSWVDALNQKNEGQFTRLTDSGFRCLVSFSSWVTRENFFSEILEKTPKVRVLDFEMNGQPCIAFGNARQTVTLAVVLFSKTGIAGVFGYDLKDLSPKIRGQLDLDDPEDEGADL